jgi:hypothetical protein
MRAGTNGVPASYGAVHELARVQRNGAWHVAGDSSKVFAEDLGGQTELVADLSLLRPIAAACGDDAGSLFVLRDGTTPAVWHVSLPEGSWQELNPPQTLVRDAETTPSPWRLKAGFGPCVLFDVRNLRIAVLERDTVRELTLWPTPSRVTGSTSEREAALDIVTTDSSILVLGGAPGDTASRIVDVYSLDGSYRKSWLLPRPVRLLAAVPFRLLVISGRPGADVSSVTLPELRPRVPRFDSSGFKDATGPQAPPFRGRVPE